MSRNSPHRATRAAGLLGVCALALCLTQAPRAQPAIGHAAAPVDSILVLVPYFSPNGDGVKDSTVVRFAVLDTTHVHVYVRARGAADTVAVLLDSLLVRRPLPTPVTWFGRDAGGTVAAEGVYEIVITATDPATQIATVNQRQVQLDLTAPLVQIVDVQPRPYTPTLPDAAQDVRLRVRVSQSELADSVAVALYAGPDTLAVPLIDAFAGDGEYIAACPDCAIDADLPDGMHRVVATGFDPAGNASVGLDSLDTNLDGPDFEPLDHPLLPVVQFADSLVGEVNDRQTIAAATLRITGPVDTLLALAPRDGIADGTFPYIVDVSTLMAAPGVYALTFGAVDAHGVGDTLRTTLRVDRTPPGPPVPDPVPPAVTKAQVLQLALQLDASTDRMYRSGGTLVTGIVNVTPPTFRQSIVLEPGSNVFRFAGIDSAGNASDTTVVSVSWEPGRGLTAPERFSPGQEIQIDAGADAASSVTVRVLAMDGSLVRQFQDTRSLRVYLFPWDLLTRDGRQVRNGAYLVVAVVNRANAEPERYRQMIAVLE